METQKTKSKISARRRYSQRVVFRGRCRRRGVSLRGHPRRLDPRHPAPRGPRRWSPKEGEEGEEEWVRSEIHSHSHGLRIRIRADEKFHAMGLRKWKSFRSFSSSVTLKRKRERQRESYRERERERVISCSCPFLSAIFGIFHSLKLWKTAQWWYVSFLQA